MGLSYLGAADYAVVGCMLCASAAIGLYFRMSGGRQKTTQEFLMGGRAMGVFPVAFSLMATYMSAISVLGMPAETYNYGTQYLMWLLGAPVGALIAAKVFLPVFYEMNVSTAYEYLEKRFGKTTRIIASILFTVQMILYMAVVLYAPSLALNAVTGLSTWASVVSLAVVCTFYCSLVGPFLTSPSFFDRYTLWGSVLSGLIFSLNTYGTNQAQLQRMLSVGHLGRAQKALFWSLPLIAAFNGLAFFDGVVIYALFHDCDPLSRPEAPIESADQLMPLSVVHLFAGGWAPGLTGLCVSGVFSASLSTVSSAVNSLTAVTLEDFIRPHCCTSSSETRLALIAKILAVCYGAFTLLLTLVVSEFRGVIEASSVLFGMVGGPVLGVYALGMLTSLANEQGTLVGLLCGFALNAWLGFGSYAAKAPVPDILPTSLQGCPTLNATMSNATAIFLHSDIIVDEGRYVLL
ncbi:hypothetical protein JTE90_008823 [Oedothorax gibbosus]|uniref:Sodium-dependent multivitamin transporter n=1 Tax=Oedothorax gibbosus TaxID=931172 RepID=A0AAV6V4S3_9ARAC|nr:hypothetical protein JTE90_008823 [Oedothorax gibbosus]